MCIYLKQLPSKGNHPKTDGGEDEESSSEEGDQDESYENIVGAYNSKDYTTLNVTAEVRDLFQYIERYKPHEVELESTLKCFIPEYIPAIGEMDAFIKVSTFMIKQCFLSSIVTLSWILKLVL